MADTRAPARSTGDDHDPAFLVAVCRHIAADSAETAKRIVDCIRAELPYFGPVDRAEHEEMVRGQVLAVMEGLASRGLPSAAHVESARILGGRRAEQGLPVEAVIGGYHVGCRELWSLMLARAQADDPGQAERLLEVVNLLLAWLRVLTSAAADGYAEAARAREGIRTSLGHQFLEALYGGQAAAESTALLARALDFDPHGNFQAICCPPDSWPARNLDSLRSLLRSATGTFSATARETALVIIFQEIPASRITPLLSGAEGATAGVGLVRPGLAGAAESITDAERALALAARQGGVVDFGTQWLMATLLPQMDRLGPVARPARRSRSRT